MILNIFSTQPQLFDYSVSPATVSQYCVTLYACNSDKEMASIATSHGSDKCLSKFV